MAWARCPDTSLSHEPGPVAAKPPLSAYGLHSVQHSHAFRLSLWRGPLAVFFLASEFPLAECFFLASELSLWPNVFSASDFSLAECVLAFKFCLADFLWLPNFPCPSVFFCFRLLPGEPRALSNLFCIVLDISDGPLALVLPHANASWHSLLSFFAGALASERFWLPNVGEIGSQKKSRENSEAEKHSARENSEAKKH